LLFNELYCLLRTKTTRKRIIILKKYFSGYFGGLFLFALLKTCSIHRIKWLFLQSSLLLLNWIYHAVAGLIFASEYKNYMRKVKWLIPFLY